VAHEAHPLRVTATLHGKHSYDMHMFSEPGRSDGRICRHDSRSKIRLPRVDVLLGDEAVAGVDPALRSTLIGVIGGVAVAGVGGLRGVGAVASRGRARAGFERAALCGLDGICGRGECSLTRASVKSRCPPQSAPYPKAVTTERAKSYQRVRNARFANAPIADRDMQSLLSRALRAWSQRDVRRAVACSRHQQLDVAASYRMR
jgi:hypothetical protein